MTREEVKAIMPNATDEEITNFLNKHNAEINNVKVQFKAPDDYKALQEKAKKFDEYEREKLSLEEKTRLAHEEAEKFRLENLKILNRTKAVSEFASGGFKEEDYNGFIDSIVTEDTEGTIASAKSIVELLAKQREATKQSILDSQLNNTPKPNSGNAGTTGDASLSEAEKFAKQLGESRNAHNKNITAIRDSVLKR